MKAPAAPRRVGALTTLAVSGLVGYYAGSRGFPEWQVPVESAQVLAGLVRYPADNPFFIYHLKLWTLLHQVCAVLLAAGVSEIRLSIILSGISGMVSFQALAMTVYAFSHSTWLSTLAAIVIFASRAAEYGARYPIFLLGTSHTYGTLGLSLLVLVAALFGCGRYGLGLFLLGLAPAVHPSLGVWLALIAGVSLAWDRDMLLTSALPRWRWFAAGVLASVCSLAVHLWMSRDIPAVDPAVASRYLSAFTTLWDDHRQPLRLDNSATALNGAALAIGLLWLTVFKRFASPGSAFVLRFVTVSAVVSFACIAISHIPPEKLPNVLVVLMPTRVVNVDAMMFGALVFGLLALYRNTTWARVLTVALAAALLLNHQGLLSSRFERTSLLSLEPRILTLGIMLVAAALLVAGAAWTAWIWRDQSRVRTVPRGVRGATDGALAAVVVIALVPGLVSRPPSSPVPTVFRDRTNDNLFATASRGTGMLLTAADLHLMQMRTRRPVLIDGGGLDGLPYALSGALQTERILRDVYRIEFFHPPGEARNVGMIPPSVNRPIWEQYSTDRWREIRRAYNVTQVLTYNDWTLRLPLVAQNAGYLLYEIPE